MRVSRAEKLSVACPFCGAQAGLVCRSRGRSSLRGGLFTWSASVEVPFHRERRLLFLEFCS